ncbi:MAG: winged helix DNA-binding domain-containing protein [Gemmatimonadaceae bacterium]
MRSLSERRLGSQRVGLRQFGQPAEVVNWLVASQAQDYSGAKWSIGLRMRAAIDANGDQRAHGNSDRVVERAFADGDILRTHLLRPTWHFVTPADIRWLLMLSGEKILKQSEPYHKRVELDTKTFLRCERLLVKALEGGTQMSREDVRELFERNRVITKGELRFSYMLMHAELKGVICSGARDGKSFSYALLDERARNARVLNREEALAELALRFFTSRGPANEYDLAKWSNLTLTEARSGLSGVKDKLQSETIGGITYWSSANSRVEDKKASKVFLFSIFDEFVSSYKNRMGAAPAEIGRKLVAMGNALTGIIVVDGRIVGTWKRVLKKGVVSVTIDLLVALSKAQHTELLRCAGDYAAFLELKLEMT